MKKSTILAVEGIATYFVEVVINPIIVYKSIKKDVELNKNSINGAEDLLFSG
ncbi:MAG: hypothetical protein H6578_06485 [Chitinophagales bacterium]|nr:hypothetical protein [Chitinophagales bacterium]